MARRVQVPCDFGKEYINSPEHSNLTLKLANGEDLLVNSVIMSYNSPEIKRLTTELHQTTLEMDDFEAEAVNIFVEALYCGEFMMIEMEIFCDVYKMAHVFKVDWLKSMSLEYFRIVADITIEDYEESDYIECVDQLIQIADYIHRTIKDSELKDIIAGLIHYKGDKKSFFEAFVGDKNIAEMSLSDAKFFLNVAGNESSLIVEAIVASLKTFPLTSPLSDPLKYLIEHCEIPSCHHMTPEVHNEFFSVLDEFDCLTKSDVKLLHRLLLKSMKNTFTSNTVPSTTSTVSAQKETGTPTKAGSSKESSYVVVSRASMGRGQQPQKEQKTGYCPDSSFYFNLKEMAVNDRRNVDDFLSLLLTSPKITNIYKLIDALQHMDEFLENWVLVFLESDKSDYVDIIRAGIKKRKMYKISPHFLQISNWSRSDPRVEKMINRCIDQTFISNTENRFYDMVSFKSVPREGEYERFVKNSGYLSAGMLIYLDLRILFINKRCLFNGVGNCAILLEFTHGELWDYMAGFNFKVCRNLEELPPSCHFHEQISEDSLHMVVESRDPESELMRSHRITCNGPPVHSGIISDSWCWGDMAVRENDQVQLRLFCNFS